MFDRAALIVVDIQVGWDDPRWGHRNNPQAESNIYRLLEAWRSAGRTTVLVQHLSTDPQSPLLAGGEGTALRPELQRAAADLVVSKNVHSAFIGTDLEESLLRQGVDTIVVCGITTVHCCSTTIRMGSDLGFRVFAVGDAMASFDAVDASGNVVDAETLHRNELAALHGEFASVITTDDVLEELSRAQGRHA
jgi:nicotinamidase-related amidase